MASDERLQRGIKLCVQNGLPCAGGKQLCSAYAPGDSDHVFCSLEVRNGSYGALLLFEDVRTCRGAEVKRRVVAERNTAVVPREMQNFAAAMAQSICNAERHGEVREYHPHALE